MKAFFFNPMNDSDNSITEFGVQNYKLLNKSSKIPIKKFNFLFGSNGSGKSTFIQSMKIFKELFENDVNNRVSLESVFEDFGGFEDLLNPKSKKNEIEFSIQFKGANSDSYLFEILRDKRNYSILKSLLRSDISLKISYKKSKERIFINKFTIENKTTGFKLLFERNEYYDYTLNKRYDKVLLKLGKIDLSSPKDYYKDKEDVSQIIKILESRNKELISKIELLFSKYLMYAEIISPFHTYLDEKTAPFEFMFKNYEEIEEEIISLYEEIFFADDFQITDEVEYFIHDIIIVPYFFIVNAGLGDSLKWIQFIEPTRVLFDQNFLNNYILSNYGSELKHIQANNAQISKILKNLFDIDQFIIKSKRGNYEIKLKIGNKEFDITDSSSGIKQILPIFIKSLTYNKTLIAIEQPELHLHPKLQSQFIEELVNLPNENFYLIETHSEHMIRKVQVLIAKKILKPTDVGVYYFQRTGDSTTVKELKISENGFFDEIWPDDFFDESYNLTKELLKANNN